MKKITLSLLLLMGGASFAQTVVWSDDFNDEDISDWTLIDSDNDTFNWGDMFQVTDGGTPPAPVTPVSLISRSWQGAPLTPDNWAISPVIDLSEASGAINLTWITQVAAADWDGEKYSVHVGTAADITSLLASQTTLTQTLGEPTHSGTPTPQSLDISSLAGEAQVYVAFRHWDSSDNDFISIDDVTVTAETLSVSDFELDSFTHFYNQNTKQLNLKSSTTAFTNVQVFNTLGQEVLKQNLSQTVELINLSNLNDGVYIAKVSMDGVSKTVKFIK